MTSESNDRAASAVIAMLSMAGLLVALQITLMVPLLPDLPQIRGVSSNDVGWLVTITLLVGAVATPIVSRCADIFGKRRMLVISLAAMVTGSLIAAIGGTFVTVLIGRGLQGFSSALIPVAMAILRDVVPMRKVASGAASISATLGLGGVLGNPFAGIIYDRLGWTSVFWVSAAVGLLVILGIMLVVPPSVTGTRGRFDVGGAVLLSIALTALMLGISKGPSWGWGSTAILGCFALTVVVLAFWVPWELRTPMPLVNVRVSMQRPVLLANIAGFFLGFASYASILATTQQLQLPTATGFGFGLSASAAGLCMIPGGLVFFLFSPISGRSTNRFGARATLAAGAFFMCGAYVFRIAFDSSVLLVILGAVLVGIGNAISYATLPALILSSVPISETAAANGLNTLTRTIGTSVMSAVVSALLTGITLDVAGVTLPAHGAFLVMFAFAAAAAFLGGITALLLPRRSGSTSLEIVAETA